MAAPTNCVPLWMADLAAEWLMQTLSPACDRIVVAGSVRRRQQTVKDIEILAVARREQGVPAGKLLPETINRLHDLCERAAAGEIPGLVRPRGAAGCRLPAWGPRYKVLATTHPTDPARTIAVDLFVCEAGQWGNMLALRTGPADFSRLLTTTRFHGGAMPLGYVFRNGWLQHRCDLRKPPDDPDAWEPIYLAEERELFDLFSLPHWEPHLRSERTLKEFLNQRV